MQGHKHGRQKAAAAGDLDAERLRDAVDDQGGWSDEAQTHNERNARHFCRCHGKNTEYNNNNNNSSN